MGKREKYKQHTVTFISDEELKEENVIVKRAAENKRSVSKEIIYLIHKSHDKFGQTTIPSSDL